MRYVSSSLVNCWLHLLVLIFKFRSLTPISRSQPTRTEQSESVETGQFVNSIKEYAHSIVRLLKSGPFVLLVLSYGLNVGVYYALSTLLSQIIKPTFLDGDFDYEDSFIASLDTKIGQMGTFMVRIIKDFLLLNCVSTNKAKRGTRFHVYLYWF